MKVNVGRDISREVDLWKFGIEESELSPVAAHIAYIGLRNILMDAHAGAVKAAEGGETPVGAVAEAMVDKKLDALYRGEIRVAGERSRKSMLEKIALAKAELYVAVRPEWRGLKAKDRTEKAKALLANPNSTFWEKAQAEIDAMGEEDVDISDL